MIQIVETKPHLLRYPQICKKSLLKNKYTHKKYI